MAENPSCYRALLAKYLSSFSDSAARWYPILFDGPGSLSSFLGLDYNLRYIPLLLKCGLIKEKKMQGGEISHVLTMSAGQQKYSWGSFLSEFNLFDLEVSFSYIAEFKKQIYLIRIGSFDVKPFYGKRFTPVEQYRGTLSVPAAVRKGNHRNRMKFVKKMAQVLPLDTMQLGRDNERYSSEDIMEESAKDHRAYAGLEEDSPDVENFKMLLKNNFFAPILKNEMDFAKVWGAIDTSKLIEATVNFVSSVQKYFCEKSKRALQEIVIDSTTSMGLETVQLQEGKSSNNFPVLKRFCIPLEESWLHGVLRDILKLSKSVEGDPQKILSFSQGNDTNVTLVPVPVSSSFYRFKRNLKSHGWLNRLLEAISTSKEDSMAWLLKAISELHNEDFVSAAEGAGLLLRGKEMDAESAVAMWEEANCNLRQQRIILRHLSNHFGRRLTVPERKLRELEEGTLLPITDSVDINGKKYFFGTRNLMML
jgi:hypothetical protein